MNKIIKSGLVFSAAIFFTITSHATSQAELKGDVPQSVACNAIQAGGRQVSMVLLMPGTPGGPLQIKSTKGFALKASTALPYYSVGMDVNSYCNYYLNPTNITIGGQSRILERLLVNSIYNKDKAVCMQVTASLQISAPDGSSCVIAMRQ